MITSTTTPPREHAAAHALPIPGVTEIASAVPAASRCCVDTEVPHTGFARVSQPGQSVPPVVAIAGWCGRAVTVLTLLSVGITTLGGLLFPPALLVWCVLVLALAHAVVGWRTLGAFERYRRAQARVRLLVLGYAGGGLAVLDGAAGVWVLVVLHLTAMLTAVLWHHHTARAWPHWLY